MWKRHSIIYLLQFKKGLFFVQRRRVMSALNSSKVTFKRQEMPARPFYRGKSTYDFNVGRFLTRRPSLKTDNGLKSI